MLLASIIATRVASRVGFPSLLLFLAVGVILGESVLGIQFDNAQLAQDWHGGAGCNPPRAA